MATNPLYISARLIQITCCSCGITFAVPERFEEELRKTHANFYCPKGHSNYYPGQSAEEKLQSELRQANMQRDAARESRDRLAAENSRVLRREANRKKRMRNGRCPVTGCDAKFADVRAHIRSVHKRFKG